MSPQQFEELDRFLGKLGFLLASDKYTLTKQQSDYIFNQIKLLDLYRESLNRNLPIMLVLTGVRRHWIISKLDKYQLPYIFIGQKLRPKAIMEKELDN